MREAVLGPPLVFAQHRRRSAADRLSTRPSTALAAGRRHQPGLRASHHRLRTVPVRSAGVQRPCPFPAGAGELGVLTVTPAKPYSAQRQYKCRVPSSPEGVGWRLACKFRSFRQAISVQTGRRFRWKPTGRSVQSGTPLRMDFGPDFGEPPLRDTSYLALACQSKYSCHYYSF